MKNNYILLLLFVMIITNNIYSQGRIIFNNNSFVVLKNDVYLVVANSNTNAISTSGTGGNLISEGENNRVKWNIGTATGTFVVPFTKSSVSNKIPLSVAINTAGVGSGNILFSTYGGATWDNSTYLPSGVTSIGSLTGGNNNSAKVVDRFWLIDAQGYTTKPIPTINFTYLDIEWNALGNSIIESDLFAQRYSSSLNDWGMWFGPNGTANITSNTVSTGTVSSAEFFRSWTLVDHGFPLPIELLYFKASCEKTNVLNFEWATATESNNEFFTVEGSMDGVNWGVLKNINGAGNSVTQLNYSSQISLEHAYTYFRLKQTDSDGAYTYSDIIFNSCDDIDTSGISIYPNPNNGIFNIKLINHEGEAIVFKITNALGQLVEEYNTVAKSDNHIETITIKEKVIGLYFITVMTNDKIFTEKIIVNP